MRSATCSLSRTFETWLRTVFSDRPRRAGDGVVPQSRREQPQHVAFPVRQVGERRGLGPAAPDSRPTMRCAIGRPVDRVAGCHRPDRADELVAVRALDEVPARPGQQGGQDRVVVRVHGEHEHRDARMVPGHGPQNVEPRPARHRQVAEDDVGFRPAHGSQQLVAVGGLPHELDALDGVQDGGDAVPDHGVVVRENDPDRPRHRRRTASIPRSRRLTSGGHGLLSRRRGGDQGAHPGTGRRRPPRSAGPPPARPAAASTPGRPRRCAGHGASRSPSSTHHELERRPGPRVARPCRPGHARAGPRCSAPRRRCGRAPSPTSTGQLRQRVREQHPHIDTACRGQPRPAPPVPRRQVRRPSAPPASEVVDDPPDLAPATRSPPP